MAQDSGDGLVSKAEYARHRGVSGAMVSHWTKAERIAVRGGKVDLKASDAMLAASLDPARGGKGGSPRGAQVSVGTDSSEGAAPSASSAAPAATGPGPDTYTRVRTHREAFRAKTEEVDYRERIGELVERDRYNKALADGLSPVLAALDSLGPRLAPVLAAESDPRRIQSLVEDAIVNIRQDMADTLLRMVSGRAVTQ
jgi:hypothetical protein